jgi:AAA15 family ATPase/GTPase
MSKFVLRKLSLSSACGSKLKILEPGEYVFTNAKYDDFFMDGVTIQAIVGKNGCGKSSLIEMLFRMSNNLSALMLKGYKRPAAEQIYFIQNVVGELHFEIDGIPGVLKCENDKVALQLDDETFVWSLEHGDCEHCIGKQRIKGETRFQKEVKASASFFYTIATNYSMQSYITDDYSSERILRWDTKKKSWEKTYDATSWIDSVFHKNDGYMSPIVLNPYRHDGTIDMAKEERLTTNRLCSMLWETKELPDEEQLIDGYRLFAVSYDFYNLPLIQKFDKKVLNKLPRGSFSDCFTYAYKQDGSIARSIMDAYGLTLDRKQSLVEKTLRIYLSYKTLNVAKKYPSYSAFNKLGDINLIFQSTPEAYYHTKVKQLVEAILRDPSHITLKIRQTLDLIECFANLADKNTFEGYFSYSDYLRLVGKPEEPVGVLERMDLLPPPIFRPHIYLIKTKEYNRIMKIENEELRSRRLQDKVININRLSSGERQFIYLTSTLIYHALNLKSVPDDGTRVKYRNLNMVLDEIEICFHPEYQRTFINKLLSLIKRTRLTECFGINILVVTHSPFVLSDIPQGNIMYLKEGHQLTGDEIKAEEITNPFCANINDILHQSFFLEKGFVGEFAKQRVLSLLDYLNGGKNVDDWSPEKARAFIAEVGEPLVREQLLGIYKDSLVTGVQDKIAIYREEIQRLEGREL